MVTGQRERKIGVSANERGFMRETQPDDPARIENSGCAMRREEKRREVRMRRKRPRRNKLDPDVLSLQVSYAQDVAHRSVLGLEI